MQACRSCDLRIGMPGLPCPFQPKSTLSFTADTNGTSKSNSYHTLGYRCLRQVPTAMGLESLGLLERRFTARNLLQRRFSTPMLHARAFHHGAARGDGSRTTQYLVGIARIRSAYRLLGAEATKQFSKANSRWLEVDSLRKGRNTSGGSTGNRLRPTISKAPSRSASCAPQGVGSAVC
jgi:hypothetical protein